MQKGAQQEQMCKLGAKLGAKLDAKIGTKSGAKLDATQGAKPDIIYTRISIKFRKRMQKVLKIALTRELRHFIQKMKKNTLKDGLDA